MSNFQQTYSPVDGSLYAERPPATEITWQMGRPIGQSPGEVRGFEERARYMASITPAIPTPAISPVPPPSPTAPP